MKRWTLPTLMTLALMAIPALVAAQPWYDDFDSYANGSGLHGQGGWRGWDGSIAANAYVSGLYSRSAPHSAEIRPTSDIVQQFTTATSGQWVMIGWVYIPTGTTGEQYFILLNTYNEGGPYNWSTQVLFNSTTGLVSDPDNPGSTQFNMIRNQWVELRVDIDLDADTQSIFYNGNLMSTKSWTNGVSGGGAVNIAALDLFSNNGSTIYWDDVSLSQGGPVSVEPTSWGAVKALYR